LETLHKRFDGYFDDDKMEHKLPSRWYNVKDIADDGNVLFSTDFTESAEDLLYKRYKMLNFQLNEKIDLYHSKVQHLEMEAGQLVEGGLRLTDASEKVDVDEETGLETRHSPANLLAKARLDLGETYTKHMSIENKLAMLKHNKMRRHRDPNAAVAERDPVWGEWRPDFYKSDEMKADTGIHPELRKMLYSTLPEGDGPFAINNEEDANVYEAFQKSALGYYKAKSTFFDDCFEN